MSNITILVVDDDLQIRRTLRTSLAGKGYDVIEASNGQEAIESVLRERPSIVLLDVNMPDMNGLETCRKIRRCFEGPIIMVTVRKAEHDKIAALDAGADDYVVKPFGMGELLARIRATLRRSAETPVQKIQFPELTIDFEKRTVKVRGERVHLTPREFEVLRALAIQQGKPVTHEKLVQTVWGPDHGEDTENLRVVIKQLRKKLEKNPANPRLILTEPWTGYRLDIPASSSREDLSPDS